MCWKILYDLCEQNVNAKTADNTIFYSLEGEGGDVGQISPCT